jgi:MinD-like ATPase involved in chromosome partitioning or flagellar assembly
LRLGLADSRFVTIVGAGGVGKTTVAVAVAHDLIETFAGAVTFIDLSALTDTALVAPTIASMLGVSTDDASSSLIAYLRDKRCSWFSIRASTSSRPLLRIDFAYLRRGAAGAPDDNQPGGSARRG